MNGLPRDLIATLLIAARLGNRLKAGSSWEPAPLTELLHPDEISAAFTIAQGIQLEEANRRRMDPPPAPLPEPVGAGEPT